MFSFGIFVVKFFNYLRNLGFIIKGDVFWKFFFLLELLFFYLFEIKIKNFVDKKKLKYDIY